MKSKIIYGCMGLGGSAAIVSEKEKKIAFNALDAAMKSGIRHFDHADIYNSGRAELVFGLWLENNPGIRKDISIQSKTGIKLHAGPFHSSFYDFSEEYILRQVDGILKRLKTDYLDMLLLHRPDPLARGDALKSVFNILIKKGLVKKIGVSNMSVPQIEWIENITGENIAANQIRFGLGHLFLVDQQVMVNTSLTMNHGLFGMMHFCMQRDIEIQAWSPLDRGRFLRLHPDSTSNEVEAFNMLKTLASRYNTEPATIALNWLMQLPATISPVIGTTNPKRIKELTNALNFNISHDEWYRLWIIARDAKLP